VKKISWVAFVLLGALLSDNVVQAQTVVRLPQMRGPKKLVAVADFENKTNYAGQVSLGTGMAEQLTDALIQSKQFIVLERADIKGVLEEQDFAASGRTTSTGGAKIGQLNRAQILIKGAVTEFSYSESGGGQGLSIKGFSVGTSSNNAHVAVIVYLYDTTTGQVLDSQRCEGKAESGGLSFAVAKRDWGFGTSGFKSTPLGKATQIAIDQAVVFIAARMASVPWQGRIVKADSSKVYLNVGTSSGIHVGDEFNVYKEGEALVDPESGLNLGSEMTRIGRVQIVQVQEKFAIATPVAGNGFEPNNIVKFE